MHAVNMYHRVNILVQEICHSASVSHSGTSVSCGGVPVRAMDGQSRYPPKLCVVNRIL